MEIDDRSEPRATALERGIIRVPATIAYTSVDEMVIKHCYGLTNEDKHTGILVNAINQTPGHRVYFEVIEKEGFPSMVTAEARVNRPSDFSENILIKLRDGCYVSFLFMVQGLELNVVYQSAFTAGVVAHIPQ